MAFPPTVKADIKAPIKIDDNVADTFVILDKLIAKTAPSPPLSIPHISPITSKHI